MTITFPEGFGKTFTHSTTEANGVLLHSVTGGKGDPVVLLHGWPLTWYSWRKIMPALAEHYTVIAPDLRGLGDSEKTAGGYDAPTVAEDIFRLVQGMGYEKVSLVGHDMGVLIAYAYAAAHRDAVRHLAVLDLPLNGFGLEEFLVRGKVWHPWLFQTPSLPEALTAGREREFISHFYPLNNSAAMTPEDVDEYVRCYAAPGGMHSGFEYYRAFSLNQQRFREYAETKLAVPVLALGGEQSAGGAPFASFAQVATNVQGGIIPNCGHYIAEEQPASLLDHLLPFLAG